MRALSLSAPGVLDVITFDEPVPAPGEVVVAMRYASICGSDVHISYDGLHDPTLLGRPGYPGHEGVGVIVESRSDRFPVGTRVLTTPPGPAGGSFAELQCVSETHMLRLPEEGNERHLLLAQQLGTTIFALKKFLANDRLATTQTAVIQGAGSAGLFFLQQLLRQGVETVIVSDLNQLRLAQATKLGAHQAIPATDGTLHEVVAAATGGAGADLVIEAAGYDTARTQAVELTRQHGVVGLFGYPERPGTSPFPVHRAFRKALTMEWISGTQAEPGLASFSEAMDLIGAGEIEVEYCLESMFSLEDAPHALRVAREQGHGAAKVGLVIGDAR